MKTISIVAIDSLQYKATAWALDRTKKFFPNSPVILVSDQEFYPCDTFLETEKFDKYGHSLLCLKALKGNLDTDYALFVQYDGFPVNADMWTDEYLNYDYIGAPWPWMPVGQNVGNGGFSLRSKRLIELTDTLEPVYDQHPSQWLEDGMIGIHHRPWLESQGIKFASGRLSHCFSHEHPFGYHKSFGFHDKANAKYFLTPEEYTTWNNLLIK